MKVGEKCRKADFYSRWEIPSAETRSLNPVCCPVSNDIVIWPFYILAILTFFLGITMLVSAAANIGLANFSNEFDS